MGKVNHHHFPEPHDYETWVDMGPEQEEEPHFEPSPSLIAGLAQLASLALFVSMIAVWAMVLDGRFPEMPQ